MIISVGIDLIEVYRIRKTISRTPRFAVRVFTEAERVYCDGKGAARFASYAARFAAKEAALKALKTGWRGKITWHDIEVFSDENGAPFLKLTGEAKEIFDKSGANFIHISISHTSEHAIATVIFERVNQTP
jgi:holo-[acyl-carrier protein] synthase